MTTWAVFTKPWRTLPPGPLATLVAGLGFTGVEVPVRPGCHLAPDTVARTLPGFVRTLADQGVEVISLAAEPTEPVLAAAAESGVRMVRTMAPVGADGYRAAIARLRLSWADEAVPACRRYGVVVGVQPHRGQYVETTLGVLDLIEELPGFELVWDAAHDALTGVAPERSLDLAWPRLGLVNLKNAAYHREAAGYDVRFGPAETGMADWGRILTHLARSGWTGPICLTAQYSAVDDPDRVAELARADLAVARAAWDHAQL